eukprot:6211369-Pleurochrysis_carterae.AAC.2
MLTVCYKEDSKPITCVLNGAIQNAVLVYNSMRCGWSACACGWNSHKYALPVCTRRLPQIGRNERRWKRGSKSSSRRIQSQWLADHRIVTWRC